MHSSNNALQLDFGAAGLREGPERPWEGCLIRPGAPPVRGRSWGWDGTRWDGEGPSVQAAAGLGQPDARAHTKVKLCRRQRAQSSVAI